MGKELSEITLEELWELFTICLVRHDVRKGSSGLPFEILYCHD